MQRPFKIYPVGMVFRRKDDVWIDIYDQYQEALEGLSQFSHIHVFYWFHKNDDPEKRNILKVHPRGRKENPLTGVFGTHSPVRPNPIAMTVCRLLSIQSQRIYLEAIDAFDGTPVIDIKGYFPFTISEADLNIPTWK
jgi:tRNA-Thr(GGU) m(6)t(6)A37 methyltransferase TsaA